jgi:hypothetical protein
MHQRKVEPLACGVHCRTVASNHDYFVTLSDELVSFERIEFFDRKTASPGSTASAAPNPVISGPAFAYLCVSLRDAFSGLESNSRWIWIAPPKRDRQLSKLLLIR